MTGSDQLSMWVTTERTLDGSYRLTVTYNEDLAVNFDEAGATAYANEVFRAVAFAEYDAAVNKQMTQKLGLPAQEAATILKGLRDDRPPLNQDALGALHLAPGVSAFTGAPFLHCSLADKPGRWQAAPSDLTGHATFVLRGFPVAVLDDAYRRYLEGSVGLDCGHAAVVVDDLQNWRVDA